MIFERCVVLARSETIQNTAVVPSASTDAILAKVEYKVVSGREKRDWQRASYGTLSSRTTTRTVEVKITTELKCSGTAGTIYAPYNTLMLACGNSATNSAGVSQTYAPLTARVTNFQSSAVSCTIEIYHDGKKFVIPGCVGSWVKTMEVNKIPRIEFTMNGIYSTPTDAGLPSATYIGQIPVVWQNSTLSMFGYSANVHKWTIEQGNKVELLTSSAAGANGIAGYAVMGREPKGTIEIEQMLVGTFAPENLMMIDTNASSSLTVGNTAGNIITMTMPATQIESVTPGNANGLLTHALSVVFNDSTGDNWFTEVHT